MGKKIVKIKEHGTAYFINEYGRLAGSPITTNGQIDETEFEIEQSPLSFKAGHKTALKRLGIHKALRPLLMKHIHYY
jgi:hypothetical protein